MLFLFDRMSRRLFAGFLVAAGLFAVGSVAHAGAWVNATLPSGGTIYGVAAWDESNIVVVGEGEGGFIYKSINNGASWSSKISSSNPGVYDIARVPGSLAAYAVGRHATDSAFMLFAANKGTGWEVIAPTGINPSADLYGVSFVSNTTGYVVGSNGLIYKTTDASNWVQQPSGVVTKLNDVDFVDANNGWAVGDNNVILRTTNGGATWSSVSPAVSSNLYGVDFINSSVGWVVGSNGTILYTENGGSSWTIKSPEQAGSSVTFRSVAAYDVTTATFVGSGGAIFTTVDGGFTISKETSQSASYLYGVAYMNLIEQWVVGQNTVQHYDATGPTVGSISPLSATAGSAVTFSISVSDSLSAIASCELFVEGSNVGSMSIGAGTASKNYTFAVAGLNEVYARCTDAAGNSANGTHVTVSVAAAPVSQQQADTTPSTTVSTLVPRTTTTVNADSGNTASNTVGLMVTIRNAAGGVLAGKQVSLSSSRTGDTITALSPWTDSLGQVVFIVRSAVPGVSTYRASVDGVYVGNSINVTYLAAAASTPSPTSQSSPAASVPSSSSSSSSSSGGSSSSSPFVSCTTTPCPGDLIRGTVKSVYGGYPVYYYTADRKKALFPNETTYKTWFADFAGVKVIAQTELEAIAGADKNVTIRPGSSVVRFESDSGLYVVEPGAIIRKIDTTIGNAVYGVNFPVLVIEVAFRANYHSGTPVSPTAQFDRTASLNASSSIAIDMSR